MKSLGPIRYRQILLDTSMKAWLLGDCVEVTVVGFVWFFNFILSVVQGLLEAPGFITCSYHVYFSWAWAILNDIIHLLTVGTFITEEKICRW